MGRRIKVNWTQVRNLGDRTAKNAEEFEQIRQRMVNSISNIQNCWQGIDANNFITNATNFLDSLKVDGEYLSELSSFFGSASRMYNGGVEDGVTRIRNLRREIEEEQNPVPITTPPIEEEF